MERKKKLNRGESTHMKVNEKILSTVESKKDIFIEVSDKIWDYAEMRFEEYKSSELLCSVLEEEGFKVKKGIAGMDTAFIASFGEGSPVIGILGEYDALSSLSQKPNTAVKEALDEGGNGHGCGHHALGAGSLAAVVAVKEYLKENNLKGTIRYYGCPAEEGGSGKVYMVREKAFEDVDIALTWHPSVINAVNNFTTLANMQAYFKFHGVSSHAAISPHLGRSALDAVELMNVGVNYLREHIIPEARVHYAITNSGGISPNVVQSSADVVYLVRAPKLNQVREIYNRVLNIAKGAALMTETTLEVVFDKACSNIITNSTLEKLMHDKFMELEPVKITEEDVKFAKEIRNTLNDNDKKAHFKLIAGAYGEKGRSVVADLSNSDIADVILPYVKSSLSTIGSTDVGDISWIVPTAQIVTACYALGTPEHSWQKVSQGKSNLCHNGMLQAGKVLALTAVELYNNPELIEKAKLELKEKLAGEKYVCPIPPEVKPSSIR